MRNQFGETINPNADPALAPARCSTAGMRGTFITFEEREPKPKTKVWAVLSQSGDEIGIVQWYGPWRKYCFMPAYSSVFEQV